MTSSTDKTFILLFLTILINYYTPIPYIGFDFSRRHNVLNRLYLSLFSAFIIVLTDIIINRSDFSTRTLGIWILLLILGIVVCYYFIANQIFIDEKEYLLTMKENHIMDLHITENILKHNKLDPDSKIYSSKIILNRNDELKNINEIFEKTHI
jgi:hypothetical protein